MTVKIYHTNYNETPFFIRADWDDPADLIQWSCDGQCWQWLGDLGTVADHKPRQAIEAAIEDSMLSGVGQAVRAMRQVSRDDFLQFVCGVQGGHNAKFRV